MTTTLGTGALDGEEALLRRATRPAPRQPGQALGEAPSALASRIAGLAAHRGRHLDLRLLALERLFEADFQIVTKIGAPALRSATARSAHEIAEEIVENVSEAAEVELTASTGSAATVLKGGMSELVVSRAFLGRLSGSRKLR